MQKIDIRTLSSKYKGDDKKTTPIIKWDTLSHIHLQTARGLAGAGISFKPASPAIVEAEAELNRIWIDCLHGEASIDDFKAINEQWAVAIRKAQL